MKAGEVAMKPRILIVDDSLTVRMDLAEMFESAGFDVVTRGSVDDALEALAGESFSLVVLDVLLPDGNGIELLSHIRENPATTDLPVIVLSSESEVKDRVRGLKAGADDYVGKPYETAHVLARAQVLIGSGPARPSGAPKILLIDDSLTFREEFRRLLAGAGCSVDAASTADEGLRMAFSLRPDAIIVDHDLGGPMNGASVIGRIKQDVMLRNTPCLLVTGSADRVDELRALESGADAYVRKETDPKVILARVSALLRFDSASMAVAARGGSLLGAKRILAVDDSLTYLHEVARQLRDEGYDVIPSTSGRDAIELLEAQPVDCILLDVRMPEMSGHEVCEMVKSRPAWRNIPLIMLTAMEDPEAVIQGINAGADDYIPKSGDFEVLKARVRAQIRRKQFEDENRAIREELLRKDVEAAEARAARKVAETRAALVDELEQKNRELEAFTYSVSHDLRAPLRSINGFGQVLLEECGEELSPRARRYLTRVIEAANRMGLLINALLELSRISRTPLNRRRMDLSAVARTAAEEQAQAAPDRNVAFSVEEGLMANADSVLVRVVFNNLLGNAWKFTARAAEPRVEVGALRRAGQTVYFVRDNGVGFDSSAAPRLFEPFERLHPEEEFAGTGIGLATVHRIIARHGGEIWAESRVGQGATFYFTLGAGEDPPEVALRLQNGFSDNRLPV